MKNNVREGTTLKMFMFNILAAILCPIVSINLLWMNELNNVYLVEEENFIRKNAVFANSDSIDRNNDYKLIWTNGSVYTNETLSDSMISIDKALNLRRNVEMYQWVESSDTEKWKEIAQDSDEFEILGYNNLPFPVESQELGANVVMMGNYKLNKEQISQINDYQHVRKLEPKQGFKIIDEYYYKGNDYSQPQAGDIRISYDYVPSGVHVSIIGQQNSDNTISPMPNKVNQTYLQYDGVFSLKEMLNKFKQSNTLLTFGLRFAGFLIMFIGLEALIDVLDFFRNEKSILGFRLVVVSLVFSLLTIVIGSLTGRLLLYTLF